MERSSRVLATPWKPENLIFFSKRFEIRILTFDKELNCRSLEGIIPADYQQGGAGAVSI